NGVEIGGDWYDLIPLTDQQVFFVIGDVSGRGVHAGTMMASLQFAIRGFVSEGHPPAAVLDRLSNMVDVGRDGRSATVLCGVVDIQRHEISLANAGHLPPLLLGANTSEYVSTPVGPPIGVPADTPYRSVTVSTPTHGTLLA